MKIMTMTRRGRLIKYRSIMRAELKAHAEMHKAIAAQQRAQARSMRLYMNSLDSILDAPEIEALNRTIDQLEIASLENENSKCVERH